MAWQNIAASETDANSPLNQTLMDKIRGNLDDLNGRTDAERTLLCLEGKTYQGASSSLLWECYAQNVSTDPGPVILGDIMVYVPSGVTEIRVKPFCYSNTVIGNDKLLVTVGSGSASFTSLPYNSYQWMSEQALSNPGTGYQSLTVRACETASGLVEIRLAGLIVRLP